jgi:hypothetical protein
MDIYEDNMGEARIHAEFWSQNPIEDQKCMALKYSGYLSLCGKKKGCNRNLHRSE